jgi:transmembrane sensor
MTKEEHIAFLLYKELEGKLSEAEVKELQSWKLENPEHEKFFEDMMDEDSFAGVIKMHHPEHKESVKQNILKKMEDQLNFKVVPLYRRNFFRIAVAACIAALIIVGGYFMFFNSSKETGTPPIVKATDVEAPKSDKAVIQLADGKIIAVDSLTSYSQGNVTVTRMADGRLVYSGLGSEVQFNTLTNPRGSKVIDMTLADGSHIWLNAGSSITYPIAFAGNERKVTMTGEVYLEVAHNSTMPFTMSKGNLSVQVLGTKFNVNAYDDEPNIKVTLLEGSVEVSKPSPTGEGRVRLKPGQQAQVSDEVKIVSNVDLDAVMAWKNGSFSFNHTDLKSIMRQVMRWYDVDVVFEGTVPDRFFTADISRDKNLSAILKILDQSKINYRVEGRKLILMP